MVNFKTYAISSIADSLQDTILINDRFIFAEQIEIETHHCEYWKMRKNYKA